MAAAEPTAQAVDYSAGEIVAGRRAAFFLSTQAIGQIKAGLAEGGDLRRSQSGARMLEGWANAIPGMFPDGSNIASSRALDSVWDDRPGFEARAAAYAAAARNLGEKAKSGDREGANAAFLAMAGTCKSCHDSYREE